jgi:pimeloyl-ACP methyl ester carboxylesterase
MVRRVSVERDRAAVSGFVTGDGTPSVVMIPSLGRGASDFFGLAERLAGAGLTSIAVDPRGIGESTGPSEGLTLHDYASDVVMLCESCGAIRVDVIGHAFGNRVARCLATYRPDLVRRVVLLAAGGQQRIDPGVREALGRCFDTASSNDDHMASVATAFFAPGHDPSPWRDGWFGEAARAQIAAVERTPFDRIASAGTADVLLIQGTRDRVAPPEVGRAVAAAIGSRARYVEVDAGHAMLPECGDDIARAVIDFLSDAGA